MNNLVFQSLFIFTLDQFPLVVENIFIQNESVSPYNFIGGKLLFITHINTTHVGTKSLRYNGPLASNNFSQSMNNKNLGISKFKKFLEDLLLQSY